MKSPFDNRGIGAEKLDENRNMNNLNNNKPITSAGKRKSVFLDNFAFHPRVSNNNASMLHQQVVEQQHMTVSFNNNTSENQDNAGKDKEKMVGRENNLKRQKLMEINVPSSNFNSLNDTIIYNYNNITAPQPMIMESMNNNSNNQNNNNNNLKKVTNVSSNLRRTLFFCGVFRTKD